MNVLGFIVCYGKFSLLREKIKLVNLSKVDFGSLNVKEGDLFEVSHIESPDRNMGLYVDVQAYAPGKNRFYISSEELKYFEVFRVTTKDEEYLQSLMIPAHHEKP